MEFIRHIHNIGQGAFYTEKFYVNNKVVSTIVYDCGCQIALPKRAIKLIKNSFNENEIIDILFISHFDADHVNGILTLKERVSKIAHVVLPELTEEEKIILMAKSRAYRESYKIQLLIEDPNSFFNGKETDNQETKIIYVKKINEEETDSHINQIRTDQQEVSQLDNGSKVASGTRLIPSRKEWIYIPVNLPIENEKIKNLKKELEDHGLTVELLKEALTDTILHKFKNCYKKVFGDLNPYSLIVYSGPVKDLNSTNGKSNIDYMPGCLYTGDANLNRKNFMETMQKKIGDAYLNNIGLIQVPHHGSLHSYNAKVLYKIREKCNYFFLSHGERNTFGHPAPLIIEDMILRNKILMCVNECPNSAVCCFYSKHRNP